MAHAGEAPDDKPEPDSGGDDVTRIVPQSKSGDTLTRILPPRAEPPEADARGAIIGVAAQKPGAPTNSGADASDSGRTVYIPAGAGKAQHQEFDPIVGWLVVTKGPGRGRFSPVYYGQNSVGRGADQRVRLDFGDQRISREAHAYFIYDDVARKFYVRDNGKANLVRHNGALVMMPTEVRDRDSLTIGDTILLFIALCGPDFDWLATEEHPKTGPGEKSKAVGDEPTNP